MTQRDMIHAALLRGDRIKCTDAYPVYHISPHSFTRIIKELRDDGIKIFDIEIPPQNGGKPYKEYYLQKEAANAQGCGKHQEDTVCSACGGSYYYRGKHCTKCGAETGRGEELLKAI